MVGGAGSGVAWSKLGSMGAVRNPLAIWRLRPRAPLTFRMSFEMIAPLVKNGGVWQSAQCAARKTDAPRTTAPLCSARRLASERLGGTVRLCWNAASAFTEYRNGSPGGLKARLLGEKSVGAGKPGSCNSLVRSAVGARCANHWDG